MFEDSVININEQDGTVSALMEFIVYSLVAETQNRQIKICNSFFSPEINIQFV